MQKIAIYPTIIEDLSIHNEYEIFSYITLIDELENEDEVIIPDEFFTNELSNFIWNNNDSKSQTLTNYFTEVILKKNRTDNSYKEIFNNLNSPRLNNLEAITGIYGNKYISKNELFIEDINNVYFVKIFYLSLVTSFDFFEEAAKMIFKNLVFLDNSFKNVSSMGNLQSTKIEIIRHLDILNRFAHDFYIEENRDAHTTMLKLNSSYGLNCTGIGGRQNSSEFRIVDTYKGIDVNPRCNSHTKLFDSRNNYRIYFSWENAEIEIGKIIIGSVGGHIYA